ncbi:MAG: hypothetical protein AAGG50_05985 [Bacteroidota bacterium]
MLRSFLVAGLLLLSPPLQAQDDASTRSTPTAIDEYVVLATGDTLRGDVTLRDRFLRSQLVVLDDSTEYELDDIVEVNDTDGNYAVARITGSPTLLRRVEAGRISLYSKTFDHGPAMEVPTGPQGLGMTMPMGGGSTTYEYFRVGTGDVQKASAGNLKPVFADHPESLALINRHQTLSYVQWGMVGVGLATLIAGAVSSTPENEGDEVELSPLVFVGAGIAVGSWIPHFMRQGLVHQSIETYNR